jgi:hypothetical protein
MTLTWVNSCFQNLNSSSSFPLAQQPFIFGFGFPTTDAHLILPKALVLHLFYNNFPQVQFDIIIHLNPNLPPPLWSTFPFLLYCSLTICSLQHGQAISILNYS